MNNDCASFRSGQGAASGGVPERYVPLAATPPRAKTDATHTGAGYFTVPWRSARRAIPSRYCAFARALRKRQNFQRHCSFNFFAGPDPCRYVESADALALSGAALRDLLSATLERNLPCRFRARGFSMAPVIRDGDVIMVCPITSRPPQLGDVIAFRHPATQALRVHRIIASRRDGYLLRGDSAQQADGLIRAEQVLGLVTQVEHNGARKRFGFGRERLLLALLSRLGLLSLARLSVGFLWRSFRRV